MTLSPTALTSLARCAAVALLVSLCGCTSVGERSTTNEESWTHPWRERSLMSPTGIDPKARDIERNLGVF